MSLLWTLGLIVVLVLGWILTLLGMPGTWVIVLAVTVYAALVPADPPADIGWPIPVAVFVLALLAEIGELAAGRASVKAEGASRRGASMAIAGSLVGGLLGMLVGSPIPIVGSLIAAVLFAAVGAIAGSIWGERAAGRSVRRSWTVGQVVFWARISGSLGKIVIATLMVLITVAARCFSVPHLPLEVQLDLRRPPRRRLCLRRSDCPRRSSRTISSGLAADSRLPSGPTSTWRRDFRRRSLPARFSSRGNNSGGMGCSSFMARS